MDYLSMIPYLQQLRMGAMYNPQQAPTPMQPPGPINPMLLQNMGIPVTPNVQQPPPVEDPYQSIMDRYQPRNDISKQYSQALQNPPIEQEPGRVRRIGAAALAGAAGLIGRPDAMQLGEDIKYPSARKNEADYQLRLKNLQAGVGEEDKYNMNQRLLANQSVNEEINRQKVEDARTKAEAANKIAQERVDTANKRAEIYALKAQIAQQVAKGGQVVVDEKGVRGKAGAMYMLYKDGTVVPIDMGKFTPDDIAEIKHDYTMQEIGKRGEVAKDVKSTASGTPQIKQAYDEDGNPIGFVKFNPTTNKMEIVDSSALPTGTSTTKPATSTTRETTVTDAAGNVTGRGTTVTKPNNPAKTNKEEKFLDVKGADISDKVEAIIKEALASKLAKTRQEVIEALRAKGVIK